jgi:hypothetical protein
MTEQPFTDEDLKRLRTFIQYDEGAYLRKAVQALLARLEAAELLSREITNIHGHSGPGNWKNIIECQLCKQIKAWRQVSGKQKGE